MSCLYVLDIKPFYVASLQIFSPIHRLFFHFIMVSFAVQKHVSLIQSDLFAFISVATKTVFNV